MSAYVDLVNNRLVDLAQGSSDAAGIARDIRRQCTGPPRVLVVGNVSTGKSTMINALAGTARAGTHRDECTSEIAYYRSISLGADLASKPLVVDLIDTPGLRGKLGWGSETESLIRGSNPSTGGYSSALVIFDTENSSRQDLGTLRDLATSSRGLFGSHAGLIGVAGKQDIANSGVEAVESRGLDAVERYCFDVVAISQGVGYTAHLLDRFEALNQFWSTMDAEAVRAARAEIEERKKLPLPSPEAKPADVPDFIRMLPISSTTVVRLLLETEGVITGAALVQHLWDRSRLDLLVEKLGHLLHHEGYLRANAVSVRLMALRTTSSNDEARSVAASILEELRSNGLERQVVRDGIDYQLSRLAKAADSETQHIIKETQEAIGERRPNSQVERWWRQAAINRMAASATRGLAADVLALLP